MLPEVKGTENMGLKEVRLLAAWHSTEWDPRTLQPQMCVIIQAKGRTRKGDSENISAALPTTGPDYTGPGGKAASTFQRAGLPQKF